MKGKRRGRNRQNIFGQLAPWAQDYVLRTVSIPATVVERSSRPASQGENAVEALAAPVCVQIHSVRPRLLDPDNYYIKAVIDGIRASGLLPDDRQEEIAEIRITQEKGTPERTIVTLTTCTHTHANQPQSDTPDSSGDFPAQARPRQKH